MPRAKKNKDPEFLEVAEESALMPDVMADTAWLVEQEEILNPMENTAIEESETVFAEDAEMMECAGEAGDAPPCNESDTQQEDSPASSEEKPKRSRESRISKSANISIDPQDVSVEGSMAAEQNERVRKTTGDKSAPILTIDVNAEIDTGEDRQDIIWHEIHNAFRTRRILSGMISGIEQMDNGKSIVVADFKGFRIVIPVKEMLLSLAGNETDSEIRMRQNKLLGRMLGAEIDFIIKGIDSKTRSVVASRKDAMLKKRQIFYLQTDANNETRIAEGRIIQARVLAVSEKAIRIEVFGVDCSIAARDLSWNWMSDAREFYSVGDRILVRMQKINAGAVDDIMITADVKSVSQASGAENLDTCKVQSKYAGKVTDVYKGMVFIRLSIGVNAIAHSCLDRRMPGKRDDISFVVTHLDKDRSVAMGIITRIIKQNL